ncbi:MAG: acetoacetate--CoA ligase [Micromonosporaceae bacterium]
MTAQDVLWKPPDNVLDSSRIGGYLRWLSEHRGLTFQDYSELWRWSVDDLAGFWSSIWDYFDVIADARGDQVLSGQMPTVRWFAGARLNYAENMLRMPGVADDEVMVIARSQTREPVELTAAQLRDQVARARAGLRQLGVSQGDRVAAYLPNIPEALVLMLATASLGAVFSSCAPEFGVRSVCDRWRQIAPKVLVTVDGYRYGEKPINRLAEVAEIRAELPSLEHVVSLPYLGEGVPGALPWSELLDTEPAPRLEFEPVPFHHPLYVLYSSGTTGLPKPITHGHGGILLEHLKALGLQMDLGPGDRFFWFTTTGWMMWNYLVSGLAVGSAIVLFDGDPGKPDLGALWRMASEAGVTYFGTSAPYLLACRKAGLVPSQQADLSALRGVGSTGAPLPPEGFHWVYETVAPEVQLMSFSGGTDLCTGFVGGAPLLPVRAGEISGPCLGAKVEAYSAQGTPVIGELGELVISAPMPSMPVGFWGDESGERYRQAYFEVFPGVWRHGDWITISPTGTCVITGRSDATLNRGGVRLGTAEFYSVVEGLDEVADSLVVHLEGDDGGAGELLLFVVLAEGVRWDDALRRRIAAELRSNLSPRHVPDQLHQVSGVPRTLSGKKLEVPVKKILTGTPADSAAAKGALANPETLAAFERLAQERAASLS